ncbi:protein Aster-C-like [Antechinus flavipes]|uniref:protein Aster-C-like n=1 Tax=Antechinus flavipes TaxID=38775 RepID=UPI0022366249|nr:protein Aster-C-like [Antechinus flavipes]
MGGREGGSSGGKRLRTGAPAQYRPGKRRAEMEGALTAQQAIQEDTVFISELLEDVEEKLSPAVEENSITAVKKQGTNLYNRSTDWSFWVTQQVFLHLIISFS